ncbi:hypothetical protein Tco_1468406 [Tanacetum coccineum]
MSIHVTAEEKTNKKNDVKARSLLLMALPNEHQLTFSQYPDDKSIASSAESLDFIFNRLQKIVTRLAILGVVIAQEDLNLKILSSLPIEWNTHVVVWMNKPEVETMSIDDLYNNFKIVEQKVKKSVGASSGAQNLAFMNAPSTSSTNDANTASPQVNTASPNVNAASPQVSTASVSDNAVYALMVENPNGQRSTIRGHARRFSLTLMILLERKEGQFRNQDNTRKQGNNEDKSTKAMLAIDGVGFDWSDMAEEQVQTNMALMAFSDSERLIVEEQLITYRKNEVLFSEEVAVLKREVACKDYEINLLKSEFEKVKQEKDGIEFKIEKFDKASKTRSYCYNSITDKSKKGLGYSAVPPPHPLIYNRPKKLDLSYSGLDEFQEPEFKGYGPENNEQESNVVCDKKSDNSKENSEESLVEEQVSQDTSSFVESSPNVDKETVFPVNKKGKPQQDDKGFVNSGCSRYMTGNIAYLSDFKKFDGGYVAFGSRHMVPDVNTRSLKLNVVGPSVNTASSNEQDSPKDMFNIGASHILEATHKSFFIEKMNQKLIWDNTIPYTTRRMTKPTSEQGFLSLCILGILQLNWLLPLIVTMLDQYKIGKSKTGVFYFWETRFDILAVYESNYWFATSTTEAEYVAATSCYLLTKGFDAGRIKEMFDINDLHGDEVNVDMPVGEKQEQSAKEREVDTSVEDSVAPTTIEEITLAQTLIQIKAAKPKVVTTAATTTTTTRPKARGVVVQEPSEFRTPQESQPSMIKDKGKAIMIEPEVPLKRKDQVALDEDLARNLQAQLEAELIEEERIARKKEEEANIALIESWDNTQAMMEADFELAQRLQTEEQGEITIEERSRLFVELMNKRKKHFAMLRAKEKRRKPPTKAQKRNQMSTYLKNIGGYKHNQLKRKSYEEIQKLFDNEMRRVNTFIPMDSEEVKSKKESKESFKGTEDELKSDKSKKAESSEEKAKGSKKKMLSRKRARKEQQQESSKRQRMEDDKETDEHKDVEVDDEAGLKKHLVIVKDDDIAIDVIPLATKPPVIIKYKLLKDGIMVHYQLIKADRSSKRYSSMVRMIQGIDREDLETLWKLVKIKHGDTRPEDEHKRVLWGDLKVMFEPNIKSDVWRILQGYKVTIWKLYDSCGVHFISTAGEKVYAAGLQLQEDLLLSRG